MDLGTVLSAGQTLFAALHCTELKEVLSIFGYESQLDSLEDTVNKINAVLRDAEAKQELSQQDQYLIEKLKDAVFEADDLFDEFVTLAEQKNLLEADGDISKKVSNFFSRSKNPFGLAYRMSNGVQKIRKKLDAIVSNQQFSLKIDSEPIRNRRPETCSYVNDNKIIGRENDLEIIVGRLLASNDHSDVSVFSIVGIGGLGKTTLSQLVYNDPRVKEAFPLRLWTCVSDQDSKELDVKSILGKILASITQQNPDQGPTMDQVQSRLRQQLTSKKYLLVLDDVWTENHHHWCELVNYLTGGVRGSCIVVTTRSHNTATITGSLMHELLGLSEEHSWRLFERTAFASHQPNPTDELISIGQKIVNKCSGVPLAIRVAGSLLYGQEKSKWQYVEKIGLINIRADDNDILPILKLSFHHLELPLKNCFRYCALFPKDYKIRKDMLIRLWMAQGYIVPLDKNQSIDDAGEEYFSILLKRCFFQDIEKDKFGEIKSCKIHDLMHDIAQNVSGKEMCALDSIRGNVDDNVRHLSISNMSECEKYYYLGKSHIRSLLSFGCKCDSQLLVGALVDSFKRLRVLDLSDKQIKCLPNSLGELLHLRYLDMSMNVEMVIVPNSITKLCNLHTLLLNDCKALKELPKDFSKLVKLRVLNIEWCNELRWMPRGMGKLTCLHTLKGYYGVGGGERCTSWKQWLDELEDLKTLTNLKGEFVIKIRWPKNAKNDVKEDYSRSEDLYLRSMEHLNQIEFHFLNLGDDSVTMENEERIRRRVMENLQPHSNLKSLRVDGYHGVKMPDWFTATHLPHLVKLHVNECKKLKYFPCLRNLCRLQSLYLQDLPMLEYIEEEEEEEDSRMFASTSTTAQKASVFPSLEVLHLNYLPKFEGWRSVGVQGMEESAINDSSNMKPQLQLCLTQLKDLKIYECPELTCTLLCPVLEDLFLKQNNERLEIIWSTKTEETLTKAVMEEDLIVPKLRGVTIDKVALLNSIPVKSFQTLQRLILYGVDEMEELPDLVQYSSSLQYLEIRSCGKLEAIPTWMPKLTSLQRLRIGGCSERLKKRCQKDPPGEDWSCIQHIPDISFDIHGCVIM